VTFDEIVARDAVDAAPLLLGWTLLLDGVGGILVEVEAYRQDDPASHSYRGETQRNAVMFGPSGRLYVYRSYGIHWCVNVVCGDEGTGTAVLLRALEPRHGIDRMRERRGADDLRLLAAGPGRLTQALGIDARHDGADARRSPFAFLPPDGPMTVEATPRIGITKAVERPWRFVLADSPWASRRPRRSSPPSPA
jgi:DNA-3-methyladenine glycosylase